MRENIAKEKTFAFALRIDKTVSDVAANIVHSRSAYIGSAYIDLSQPLNEGRN
ncbi:MAG: hypothetical protein AAGH78_08860 [Cyanobacteria bacterium P01_H01_bin.58]